MAEKKNEQMEAIVSLAKRRGFIYPGSDVYGGLSGTWDYGPLGVTLKKNIMNLWWKMFVEDRDDIGVRQSPGGFGFLKKPSFHCLQFIVVVDLVEPHGLDRHESLDRRIFSQIHHPH